MKQKMALFTSLLAMSWLISGCNGTAETSSPTAATVVTTNLEKRRIQDRNYYVAKPENGFDKNKAYKLLLAFHGSGMDAASMQAISELESYSNNYLIVYPQSKVEEWNEGCDCNKPHRLGIDDLGFVEQVVADMQQRYNILEGQIYAVGFSQGGLFTQNLMCNSQIKFKALASVASPMSKPLSQSCQIENNTNYLLVQGTNDSVLPYHGIPYGNFALTGSEKAIEIIARQNNIETPVASDEANNIVRYTYKNDHHINQLVSVTRGRHTWSFKAFNTSAEVIQFFENVSDKALDVHSSLYRTTASGESNDIHVRSMGLEHQGPAVILLSGFNKNFHADSAWFSLLQPLIAKTHRVHVIERLGNGFSSLTDNPSYTSFTPLLDQTLAMLNEPEIIMASFASGNILAQSWYRSEDSTMTASLKGMLWIDPDILLPHSIAFYQDWPVSWYRGVEEQLIPHIEAGNWTQRTLNKLAAEREADALLISQTNQADMDWDYYDLISSQRASIEKQLVRAREIINYHDDLDVMRTLEVPQDIPVSVIDTDFESADIATAEPEFVETLTKWLQEGTAWSQLISERSGGEYIPLENSDHMVVFQHPEQIINAIVQLSK